MKLLFTLICDDVRFENTNKLIFVGVYNYCIAFPLQSLQNTQMSPPGFPLPKLCIVRRWLVEGPGQRAKTEVRDPTGKPLVIIEREIEVLKDGGYTHEIFQVLGPILVPGIYTIHTAYEDRGVQTNEEHFEVRAVGPGSMGQVTVPQVVNTQG